MSSTEGGETELYLLRLALVRGRKVGSGYALAADLVLTAAHLVGAERDACTVQPHDGDEHPGTVLWRADHLELDAALVGVESAPWEHIVTGCTWAELRGAGGTTCVTLGYPQFMRTKNGEREHEEGVWQVTTSTGLRNNRYALNWKGAKPRDRRDSDGKLLSRWAGLSGGPVLTSDGARLLGVALADQPGFSNDRIEAVRVRPLLHDPDFAKLVGAGPADLVPVQTSVAAPHREKVSETARPPDEVFDVDLLSPQWKPAEEPPRFSCVERYRLDALVGTSAGPFTLVLGDVRPEGSSRAALADTLNTMERTAVPGAQAPGRVWFELADEELGDLRDADAIANRLVASRGWQAARQDGACGRRIGFVVPVADRSAQGIVAERRQVVRRTVQRLREVLPAAAVIVQATAPLPFDAARAASDLAAGPGPDGMRPTSMVLRSTGRSERTAPHQPPDGHALATLVARIQQQLLARGLHWSLPTVDGIAGDGSCGAAEVVNELNAQKLPIQQELRLLRLVRTVFPSLYLEVLDAHARSRTGRHRYISLALAAESAEDLPIWLDAATVDSAKYPDPADVPTELMDRNLAEAMLLELVYRQASVADVTRWVEQGVGHPSRVLLSMIEWTRGTWRFDFDVVGIVDQFSAGLIAQAAVRSRLTVLDLPPTAADCDLYWAMLVRGELNDAVVEALGRLPDHLRAVVGRGSETADIELLDVTSKLRQQLPHFKARSI